MIKVKYVGNTDNTLTYGKVYDVLEYKPGRRKAVTIIDDFNNELFHFMITNGSIYLEDVSIEYRNNLIDEILR